MWKYTIRVDGMMCSMCESHVNDAVRKALPVKKVTSSHTKKQTVILTEAAISEEEVRRAIEATGYRVLSISAFTGLCFDLLPTLSAAPESAQPDTDSLPHYFRTLEQELSALRQLYSEQKELDGLEKAGIYRKTFS